MKLKITPEKIGSYYEPCRIDTLTEGQTNMYPLAFVHIDTFWQGSHGKNALYNLLNSGKTVILDVDLDNFTEVEEQPK